MYFFLNNIYMTENSRKAQFKIVIGSDKLSALTDNEKNVYFKEVKNSIKIIAADYEFMYDEDNDRSISIFINIKDLKHTTNRDNTAVVSFYVPFSYVTEFYHAVSGEDEEIEDMEYVQYFADTFTGKLQDIFPGLVINPEDHLVGGGIRKTRKCKKGSRRNPKTGKCRKPCGVGKRRNRKTHRCINKRIR